MESQPPRSEFRNNPENLHPLIHNSPGKLTSVGYYIIIDFN